MWIYETTSPSEPTSALRKLVLIKPAPKGYPPITRVTVAVWSAPSHDEGKKTFWVGVRTYSSPAWELFDNTFTDNVLYKNEWKKQVLPKCKNGS